MSFEAIILAGGRGTRLQSVISEVPKPMAPVANKPFLTYLLNQLSKTTIRNVKLSVGYKHHVIIDYFGHSFKQLKLEYVVENTPLGTGGGIRLAAEKCRSENVVVLNGDTYFDIDFKAFQKQHIENKCAMTIALKDMQLVDRYGMVELNDNQVVGFSEKSTELKSGWINGGIYALNLQQFMSNTVLGVFSMETDFMEKQVNRLRIEGYKSKKYFIDIGIPEDYQKANVYFEN